jgi:hypothetical protein
MAYFPFATEFGAFYRLVGPDGSVATFNDPTDPSYVGALTEVTGLDSADIREAASDLTEADGGAHGAFYFGRRPITMTGRVFGHSSISERNIRMDRARRASAGMRGDSILSWKPSRTATNFVTNPGAEVDLTGIGSSGYAFSAGSTVTRSAAVAAQAGGFSAKVDTAASGKGVAFATATTLKAGTQYRMTFWARTGSGTAAVDFYIMGVSGEYSGTGTANAVGTATVTNAWTKYTWLYTPAADIVNPALEVRSTTATAQTFYVDTVSIAAEDFIEMFTTVRRQQPFRESGAWVKEFQIPLVSEFAYLYSVELKTSATGVAAENRGNAPAYPIVVLNGTSTNPTMSDGTRVFRTTGLTLASGETVEFDMLNHTGLFTVGARQGQSANRYIDFTNTAWPYLAGLGTTQTFTQAGGGSGSIRYRDAWL